MRRTVVGSVAVVLATTGCGSGGETPPDGALEPDAARPAACRRFGPLERDAPLQTTSGGPFHPEGIVADPFVAYEDGVYRMWFTSVDWTLGTVFDATDLVMGTAYADSVDGLAWDDRVLHPTDPKHKIDLVLRPGGWDPNGVETVTLARTSPDQRVAYYTGDRADGTNAIGRARSSDGIAWLRDDGPVLEPLHAWEMPVCINPPACTQSLGGVLEPSVVIDPSGTHHVWYAALGLLDEVFSMRIGHAWSDDGIAWQRAALPVFEPGPPGAWDEMLVSHTHVVTDPAGGYHLFYQGISQAQQAMCDVEGSCPFYTPGSIGHAFSEDGTTWTRDPDPILIPDTAGGDGFFVGGPSALFRDGQLELFYFGIASRDDAGVLRSHLGRARAPCLE